jgi:hypothetical protein
VHFVTKVSWHFGISVERGFFYTHHDHIQYIKKIHDLLGLGLNFELVCAVGFLANFRDILDFAVLDLNLNITDSRLSKFSKKLKFGGPYLTVLIMPRSFSTNNQSINHHNVILFER